MRSLRARFPSGHLSPSRRRGKAGLVALAATIGLLATGCAGAGSLTGGGDREVTVAMVSNSQMQDAIKLSGQFEQENPGTKVRFVTLSENEARAKITASVATGGGEFDVVMISNYETPMWAKNGWLVNLTPYMDADTSYNANDFIPTLKSALSYQGSMYSARSTASRHSSCTTRSCSRRLV